LTSAFTWRDGERTIAFGRGAAARAVELLGGPGYTLLTTPRAEGAAPHVVAAASTVHHVRPGPVDELAAALLDDVATEAPDRIAALGGGRVIDVAKAVTAALAARAAADGTGAPPGDGVDAGRAKPGPEPHSAVAWGLPAHPVTLAVPTTLSGAEMTRGHRHARGVDAATPRVRPAVVVCDPALAASQPEAALAASALNALGHAVEAPCTTRANPVATLAAHDGARRIVAALRNPGRPDRDELALGALLAGYAIGSTGLGLHHVLAQTLVRSCGAAHGAANAVLLPHTIGALAWRRPTAHDALTAALGEDPAAAAARLAERAGAARLDDIGVDPALLHDCASEAAARDELDNTPPRAEPPEILSIYEQAR
jgi:alcohol dehydrogenase class IV